jgi:hypothetical protein
MYLQKVREHSLSLCFTKLSFFFLICIPELFGSYDFTLELKEKARKRKICNFKEKFTADST